MLFAFSFLLVKFKAENKANREAASFGLTLGKGLIK